MIRSPNSWSAAAIVGVVACLAGCNAKGPEALPLGTDPQAGASADFKKGRQAALEPKKLYDGRKQSGRAGPLPAAPEVTASPPAGRIDRRGGAGPRRPAHARRCSFRRAAEASAPGIDRAGPPP